MSKWLKFGSSKSKKSVGQLYSELKKLEQQEKNAQEKALIQQRIADLKHAKRNSILQRVKGEITAVGKGGMIAARGGYRIATSKKAKKLYKKLEG